jgi:hypothetical protein
MKENDEKFLVPSKPFLFFTCNFFPKSEITNEFFENEVVFGVSIATSEREKKMPFFYNLVIRMYVAINIED